MAPSENETAKSDMGDRLFGAAWLCALGGWLPAVTGDWRLLALAALCLSGSGWAAWRDARRLDRELAAAEADRRPLRGIAAAEREALARHCRDAP